MRSQFQFSPYAPLHKRVIGFFSRRPIVGRRISVRRATCNRLGSTALGGGDVGFVRGFCILI